MGRAVGAAGASLTVGAGATLTIGSGALVPGLGAVSVGVSVGSSGGGADGVLGKSGASVGIALPPVVGSVVDTAVVVSRGSGLLSLEHATNNRVTAMEAMIANR